MIFESITFENFGPYYGSQTMDVAPPGEKNVTLVLGQNQVGKTSLLRAILWCLYGELLKDDANQEVEVLNNQAEAEKLYEASVSILFWIEQSGSRKRFEMKRFYKKSFIGGVTIPRNESWVKLVQIDNGNRTNIDDKDIKFFINKHAPESLAKYFFIKGENFAFVQNRDGISGAIKELLGVNKVDVILDQISAIKKNFEKQIRSSTRDIESSKLAMNLDSFRSELEQVEVKVSNLEDGINDCQVEIGILSEQRNSFFEQSHADGELKQLNKAVLNESQKKQKLEDDFRNWFQNSLISFASTKISQSPVLNLVFEKAKLPLPTPFKEQFIDDIIAKQTCICGGHLEPGSPSYLLVQKLREKGDDGEVESKFHHLRTFSFYLSRDLKLVRWNSYNSITSDLKSVETSIKQLDYERAEKVEKVKGFDKDSFEKLNQLISQKQNLISQGKSDRKDLLKRKDFLLKEITSLQGRYEESIKKDETLVEANRQLKALDHLLSFVKNKKITILEDCRKNIERQVNSILASSLAQAPEISVLSNFNYTIKEKGIAGGPKRVIDLAFTASILNINKEGSLNGILIPLVADATLGEVDEDHRRAIASFLPRLAPQLIVLVSGAQAYSFSEFLLPRLSKCYVMNRSYQTKINLNESEGDIVVFGKNFKTKKFNQEKEFTNILEVNCEV